MHRPYGLRRDEGEKTHRANCVGGGGGPHLVMAAGGALEELKSPEADVDGGSLSCPKVKANKGQVPVSTHENAWLGSRDHRERRAVRLC